MPKFKIVGVLLAVALAIGGIYLISRKSATVVTSDPNSVAVVNGISINRSDYELRLAQMASQNGENQDVTDEQRQNIVTQMVSEELLRQDAQKRGISVSNEEIDAQLQELKSRFESEDKYQEALKGENLTEDQLKSNIQNTMVLNKYVDEVTKDKDTSVTDKEIQSYYDESVKGTENGPSLEEVRGQIEQQLQQQKIGQIMQQIVDELRQNSDIQILL